MMLEIMKCGNCSIYTLKKFCPDCGNKTLSPKPARFSIDDKWGYWRRKAKKDRGLL